jgi:hypothetical protein
VLSQGRRLPIEPTQSPDLKSGLAGVFEAKEDQEPADELAPEPFSKKVERQFLIQVIQSVTTH